MGKPRIPAAVKRAVLERSGGRCEYRLPGCGGEGNAFCHDTARSYGGKHTVENVRRGCEPCHTKTEKLRPSWVKPGSPEDPLPPIPKRQDPWTTFGGKA